MRKKNSYYSIKSRHDNFLYGVFPKNKDGLKLAKLYIKDKLSNNKIFYIKSN